MASRRANGVINKYITVNPSPEKLGRAFGIVEKSLADFRGAFRQMAPVMAACFRRAISSRGASIGHAWPQSTLAYLTRKARAGFGRADYILTGLLSRTVTSPSGVTLSLGRRSARFGTRLPQARSLQFREGMWVVEFDAQATGQVEDLLSQDVRQKLARVVDAVNAAGRAGGVA